MQRCLQKPEICQCWQVRGGEPKPEWMDNVSEDWTNKNLKGWWFVKHPNGNIIIYSPEEFENKFIQL